MVQLSQTDEVGRGPNWHAAMMNQPGFNQSGFSPSPSSSDESSIESPTYFTDLSDSSEEDQGTDPPPPSTAASSEDESAKCSNCGISEKFMWLNEWENSILFYGMENAPLCIICRNMQLAEQAQAEGGKTDTQGSSDSKPSGQTANQAMMLTPCEEMDTGEMGLLEVADGIYYGDGVYYEDRHAEITPSNICSGKRVSKQVKTDALDIERMELLANDIEEDEMSAAFFDSDLSSVTVTDSTTKSNSSSDVTWVDTAGSERSFFL